MKNENDSKFIQYQVYGIYISIFLFIIPISIGVLLYIYHMLNPAINSPLSVYLDEDLFGPVVFISLTFGFCTLVISKLRTKKGIRFFSHIFLLIVCLSIGLPFFVGIYD